jgi:hypothetical protein
MDGGLSPDTNSTSLEELVNWLSGMRVGGATVINGKAVTRVTPSLYWVEGTRKRLLLWDAGRRLVTSV